MAFHSAQTPADGIHVIHALEYADDAARNAATPAATDIGKVARTLSTGAFHVLIDDSPLTWQSLAGTGVTDHGALTGLGDDDHSQYLRTDGTRALTGPFDAGAQDITNVGAVDGRDVGTDGTKLDTVRTAATSAARFWGNTGVSATTTTRFLTPGWGDATAPTAAQQFRAAFPGTAKNMRVRHNSPAGNGNAIVYTLRVNGAASALTCSLNSTANDASDTTHTVAVSAGDLLDIQITKAASVGSSPSDVTCEIEYAAP